MVTNTKPLLAAYLRFQLELHKATEAAQLADDPADLRKVAKIIGQFQAAIANEAGSVCGKLHAQAFNR